MKLALQQLSRHLSSQLLPLYWISGDEPLLVQEAQLLIRHQAQQRGFSLSQSFSVDNSFSIETLSMLTQNFSLFADQQLIELTITGTVPEKFSQWLKEYCAAPRDDILLLIKSGKLTTAQTNTSWYKAIEQCGGHLAIWPIESAQLPAWISQRAQQHQLKLPLDAAQYLANRTEGNLLAANQELEKLALSYTGTTITLTQLTSLLEDQARFDVFNLTSAVLRGETARAWRILQHLKSDPSEFTLILWALSKELRSLITLHLQKGKIPLPTLYKQLQIWDKRVHEMQVALNRLHLPICEQALQSAVMIDQAIKGVNKQDPWELISHWVMSLAGGPTL